MPRTPVTEMPLSRVYPLLLQKVERKGRSKAELDAVIAWLTGHDMNAVDMEMSCGEFFRRSPAMNPRAALITGKVCGVDVAAVEDPLLRDIRRLDKLVDELARGWPLERIFR